MHPTHLSDERESQHVQWTGQQDDINGRKVYQTSLQCAWREEVGGWAQHGEFEVLE